MALPVLPTISTSEQDSSTRSVERQQQQQALFNAMTMAQQGCYRSSSVPTATFSVPSVLRNQVGLQDLYANLRQQQQQSMETKMVQEMLASLTQAHHPGLDFLQAQGMSPSFAALQQYRQQQPLFPQVAGNNMTSVFSSLGQQQQQKQEELLSAPNVATYEPPQETSLALDQMLQLDKQSFPERVYFMLEQEEKRGQSSIISFLEDGKTFRIHDPRLFETDIMPMYFSSHRMTSFQRQLNIYGFTRILEGPLKGAYVHEHFQRGKKDNVLKIKRIKKQGPLSRRKKNA